MKIIKRESSNDTTNVAKAIRRLEYIQNNVSKAIEWLKSDADCKDATCEAAAALYQVNDLVGAMADDAIKSNSGIATENIASTSKLEGNNVSGSIPDEIDNFLQDVAQMTNVISYNDIIKFGNKLAQSEQYRKYALGGIEHLRDRWGEALLYEDELMMDDIAYDVKSYMTFPIQKTVTKESDKNITVESSQYDDFSDDELSSMYALKIKVTSGINSDGFDVTVVNARNQTVYEHSYSFGWNASWDKRFASKDAPYVSDIIKSLCDKYDIPKENIFVYAGMNVFSGKPVKADAVERFKTKYVNPM